MIVLLSIFRKMEKKIIWKKICNFCCRQLIEHPRKLQRNKRINYGNKLNKKQLIHRLATAM